MARTSAKAKKSKQEVNKTKEEAKQQEQEGTLTGNESAGDSTDKENDSINYEVEKITHTRIFKGRRQYLVRWKGYTEDSDTWETESALQSCKEILEAFKKDHLNDADSGEEGSEEEEEDKGRNKNKKLAKKTKKGTKKSGRSSTQKKETDDVSEKEPSLEPEEVKVNIKEKPVKESEESSSVQKNKNKGAKGKKRSAAKETESSKGKKVKKDESDDESITDGKNYEVEKILEVHTRRDGSHEFLIRWKGYKPSDDTWEPEAHLDCQELIEKFMEKVEKAKEFAKKELRENRTQTKRFIPLNTRVNFTKRSQRNSGFRPCYQETPYED